ncbi:MAG: hypothetical protein ACRC62_15365 [Microcoleus sp.]
MPRGRYTIPTEVREITVNRSMVVWMVAFELPDEWRDRVPIEVLAQCDGTIAMNWYADPVIGDVFKRCGFWWKVERRQVTPTRFGSREEKTIPTVFVLFLGENYYAF